MNGNLSYKGYTGSVEYSANDNVLHGKVMGIRGLISYEGNSIDALVKDFHESVDFYLTHCEETGKAPILPYCGNLSDIQISPSLHQNIYRFAQLHKKTPGQMVEEALEHYININSGGTAWAI
jgi:predicted HicB family RNase H-like nuclease